MLEPGAPLFKSYGRYLPFAALLPFSSLQVVSKLRMWGWQGKGDFLEQEQKTSDCVLWRWAFSRQRVSLGRASGREGGG